MKFLKYLFVFLCITTAFTACQEVVEVDLDPAEPRLVIDAGIKWGKGTDGSRQTIKLTKLADYYAPETPVVSGATVFVENSAGVVFDFIETPGTGEYVCTDFVPVIGETYELTVINEGQTYTATESLIAVPEITRIEQDNDGGFIGGEIQVTYFYNDDGDEENFYLSRFDTGFLPYPEYFTINDDFSDGNEMSVIYYHEDLASGDQLEMSLGGVSERYYDYLSIILSSIGGGPFQTPRANVQGNIINLTDEENHALGYFRLSEVDSRVYTVE
jgi:hypothetical protein